MPLFGWLLCVSPSIGNHLCSRCFQFLFASLLWIVARFDGTKPPTHSNSAAPPLFGWLMYLSFKFRPLNAKTPFCLYFSTCVASCPPSKPTNGGAAKPDHGRLAWDHRRLRHHVLWVPLTYPWSDRVKPLGVEWWRLILVVVCFVFCVVVASGLFTLPTIPTL